MLKRIFLGTLVFFFATISHADSAAQSLTSILLSMQTMEADFSQSVKDKTSHSLQQTYGHMALVRPGKFRWEVTRPTKQLIIANGKRLWIYDPDLEQVTIQTFHAETGKTPALLLSDKSLTLDRDYNVQSVPVLSQIAGSQTFLLTPKDKDDPMNKIKLSFINKKIREMQLEDHLGHTTTIAFNNVKMGVQIADSQFVFHQPANVDVIDETKDNR